MKAWGVVALLTAVMLCGSASAYAAAPGTTTGLVNIDLKNVPVKQAIEAIFDGRGMHYIIEPGVTGNVVELKLKGITVPEALQSLGDAAGFAVSVEDNIYMIGPKTAVASASGQPAAQADQSVPVEQVSNPPVAGPRNAAQVTSSTVGIGGPLRPGGPMRPIQDTPPFTGLPGINSARGNGVTFFSAPLGTFATQSGFNGNGFNGSNGWNPGFNNGYPYGGYYPYYSSSPPWIMGVWPNPPPPEDWVSTDQERLLRFQWAVTRRPSFIMPPYWY